MDRWMVSLAGALVLTGLVGLAGCATSNAGKIPVPSRKWLSSERSHLKFLGSEPAFEAVVTRFLPGKPPLVNLTVEVVLRNLHHKPRWFLLPRMLPREPKPPAGGVYAVEGYAIESAFAGRCLVAVLHGNEEASALLLPGQAQVRLKGLEIGYRQSDEPTQSVELIVRTAGDVSVGGAPLHEWFATDPVSDRRVEADYAARVFLGRRGDMNAKEVPLVLPDEDMLKVTVPLVPPAGEGR